MRYEMCKSPDGNFGRNMQIIFNKAGIKDGVFHDFRGTCITEWLEKGLMPHEVQKLAGHADIKTTMNYYVGIRESLIDRARGASSVALDEDSSALFVCAGKNGIKGKKKVTQKTAQALTSHRLTQTKVTKLKSGTI
jgi:hypothetical protein